MDVNVTEDGRVYSNTLKRYLSISQNAYGYNQVNFGGSTYRVCRLVAKKFVPNPDNKPEVNHKDEDKTNDHYTNLEWVTRRENILHTRCKPVAFMQPDGQKIIITNIKEFCEENNLQQSCLNKVKLGQRKSHKGYKLWISPN